MTNPPTHQVMATLSYGDAISNEALGIQRALRAAGYSSRIYVETADPRVEHLTEDYRDLLNESHSSNVLIHHFSIGSRASRVAFALPDRMVLIYHNVTPPEYFIDVNETLVNLCYQGRRELSAYRTRCDLALGDSAFNRRELDEAGFPRTGVLPVVPNFSQLDVEPNPMLTVDFDDGYTNILFVGRMIPNKKIDDLIRFFCAYRLRFNRRSRLLLVGAKEGFEEYVVSLQNLIATLQVPNVHLLGHISNQELTALYDVADVFLSASEHEGFCVPLVESFYKQIPVIAFSAAAVPDTMDGGGILYDRKDPQHVASLIHTVITDAAWKAEVLRAQNEALDRLQNQDFDTTLMNFVERVHSSPRIKHPPVETDFWKQFQHAEDLEELQVHRPSAYGALPDKRAAARKSWSR